MVYHREQKVGNLKILDQVKSEASAALLRKLRKSDKQKFAKLDRNSRSKKMSEDNTSRNSLGQ